LTQTAAHKLPPNKELSRFKRDLSFYCNACLRIRTKRAKLEYLSFNHAQSVVHKRIAAQYKKHGYVRAIVLKARQEGVSTYVAARFFRRLTMAPYQQALVVADDMDRAKTIFSIYDRYWRNMPDEIRPMKRFSQKGQQLWLDNPDEESRQSNPGLDSMIGVETANNAGAGRASTIQMLHATEMAFWDNAADVWISLAQAVPDDDSEIIVESTANGVGGLFYEMWQSAIEGQNEFIPIFLPWWIHEEYQTAISARQKLEIKSSEDPFERWAQDDGIEWEGKRYKLKPEQLMWRRKTIANKLRGDERAFRQEYPSTSREAFVVSGSGFFDEDALREYEQDAKSPTRCQVVFNEKGGGVVLRPAERGYLRMWKPPEIEGRYVIAADTASGRRVSAVDASFSDPDREIGGSDFSCADVYEVRTREQVAQLHGRMAPEVFASQLHMLGYLYSVEGNAGKRTTRVPCLLAVERNHSSGETVLQLLKEQYTYPSLYYARPAVRRRTRPGDRLGWITSVETRMPMLDALAAAVRRRDITINGLETIREMFTFVRGDDGRPFAQEGAHDDRVISLAIALAVSTVVPQEPPRGEVPRVAVAATPTGWTDFGY
jgi:hypothetical protein